MLFKNEFFIIIFLSFHGSSYFELFFILGASWQNKQNGMCAQRRLWSAWASEQSGQSLCCPHKEAWVLSYPLSAQRRLWSNWVDAQAVLCLRWMHSDFVGFVMRRLNYCSFLMYPVTINGLAEELLKRSDVCYRFSQSMAQAIKWHVGPA